MTYLYNLYKPYLNRLVDREDGQGMAEYGLILVLVSIAAITGLHLLGVNLLGIFNYIGGQVTAPTT